MNADLPVMVLAGLVEDWNRICVLHSIALRANPEKNDRGEFIYAHGNREPLKLVLASSKDPSSSGTFQVLYMKISSLFFLFIFIVCGFVCVRGSVLPQSTISLFVSCNYSCVSRSYCSEQCIILSVSTHILLLQFVPLPRYCRACLLSQRAFVGAVPRRPITGTPTTFPKSRHPKST